MSHGECRTQGLVSRLPNMNDGALKWRRWEPSVFSGWSLGAATACPVMVAFTTDAVGNVRQHLSSQENI